MIVSETRRVAYRWVIDDYDDALTDNRTARVRPTSLAGRGAIVSGENVSEIYHKTRLVETF